MKNNQRKSKQSLAAVAPTALSVSPSEKIHKQDPVAASHQGDRRLRHLHMGHDDDRPGGGDVSHVHGRGRGFHKADGSHRPAGI